MPEEKVSLWPLKVAVMVLYATAFMNAGSALERRFPSDGAPQQAAASTEPIWFQKSDCATKPLRWQGSIDVECTTKLLPRTMTLSFVPRERVDAESPPTASSQTGGFARIGRQPCEIVIPIDDGTSIVSWPSNGRAMWEMKSFGLGDTIAHEILHCYTGRWHLDPAMMELAEKRRMLAWWRQYRENPKMFAELYLKPRLKSQMWERPAKDAPYHMVASN